MAIRFRCVGCSQPIEIDDQWATKSVACPYCRRTMTAPAESTLDDLRLVPVATPLGQPASMAAADAALPVPGPTVAAGANRIAAVALALAILAVAFGMLGTIVSSPHALELADFQKSSAGVSQMDAAKQILEKHGGVLPSWMMVAGFSYFAAFGLFIASLICGIIGVRRPQRRGLAIAAICISGSMVVLACGGTLLSQLMVGMMAPG